MKRSNSKTNMQSVNSKRSDMNSINNKKSDMNSVSNSSKKTDVQSCNKVKNNSSKKITGFEDSKSFELDRNNENSFELE